MKFYVRNLATDSVPKLPIADRGGLPPLIQDVVESKGILIGYSNDLDMEVNLNCTLPTGDKTVEYNVVTEEKILNYLPG